MTDQKKGFHSSEGLVLNFDTSEIAALPEQDKRKDIFRKSLSFIYYQIEAHKERLESLLLEYDALCLQQVENSNTEPKAGNLIINGHYGKAEELLGCAWNTIDWIERLRKVMGASVGIRQRDDWYQRVMAALKPANEVRNFLQHIDREQKTLAAGFYTAAGVLSAAFKLDTGGGYVRILVDARYRHRKDPHLHIPGVKGVPKKIVSSPDFITLTVASYYIELSSVLRAVLSVKKELGINE